MKALNNLLFGGAGATTRFGDLGLLIQRLGFGLAISIGHGMSKVYHDGSVGLSDQFLSGVKGMNFPAPTAMAWLAALTEFLGGLLIALGLMTRPVHLTHLPRGSALNSPAGSRFAVPAPVGRFLSLGRAQPTPRRLRLRQHSCRPGEPPFRGPTASSKGLARYSVYRGKMKKTRAMFAARTCSGRPARPVRRTQPLRRPAAVLLPSPLGGEGLCRLGGSVRGVPRSVLTLTRPAPPRGRGGK